MKQRLTSLDIKILVSEAEKSLADCRLQNIYTLANSNRSYLLKFGRPDLKVSLIIDSGFKFHTTKFQRPVTQLPSNFVVKLRKHIKSKRLSNVKQVGDDRIVVFEFANGLNYLVLEFFSAGNIILLDENLKILSLQRTVSEHQANDRYAVAETYQMFTKSLFEENSVEKTGYPEISAGDIKSWVEETKKNVDEQKGKVYSIHKQLFLKASYLSSDLIHIHLIKLGIEFGASCFRLLEDETVLQQTTKALHNASSQLEELVNTPADKFQGYILSKKNPLYRKAEIEKDESSNLEYIYEEFHPFEPIHKVNDNTRISTVTGYNNTIDEFFSTIETSKHSLKQQAQQHNAEKRLQQVKDENEAKISKLTEVQQLNFKKAELIVIYSDLIEQCKSAVQSLLDQQMDWKNIEKLISIEKNRGSEVAAMINLPLNLKENKINVNLPDSLADDDHDESDDSNSSESESESESDSSDSETEEKPKPAHSKKNSQPTVSVSIDLGLSAYANSTSYFDAVKVAQEKQTKTEKNANMALKNTEKKIALDMKRLTKQQSSQVSGGQTGLVQLRNKFWFEKFYWFISSDGFLCVAGRDTAQVDLLYYKYFNNSNDVLVSNDLDNALKVFIKNPYSNKDIPPTTFIQAGVYSLSTTKAWDNKIVTSPWFVKGVDVSKKDYDGTILPSGMLNVARERTYLPPCQLVMGFGLLWIGDDETTKKYKSAKKTRDSELELKLVDAENGKQTRIDELKEMVAKIGAPTEEDSKIGQELQTHVEDDVETISESINSLDLKPPGPNDQIQSKIRGKKAKLKKIKQKYGDQDEEERRLRMSVLGTLKQVEKKKSTAEAAESADTTAPSRRPPSKKIQEANRLRKLLEELEQDDDIAQEDGEESEVKIGEPYWETISGLIAAPNKSDKILDCIPVFTPWPTLNRYKYKIKVQPGNNKKGKSISDVIDYFSRSNIAQAKSEPEDSAEWFDKQNLVAQTNQQNALMAITPTKLKIVLPGGSDSKSKGKTGKKK
ncbi:unnamed protein product [Kuraishia capsulata CBS 1993]|uniref:Ribosome quality control complex subunit 2 n=1 Tax=Kuraishia capsulata CBS 1993 TaxID=1382522 RepID=W6MUH9_9ASCO|nr:uncharacterized protein KUCA_T00001610001 [Kuraishia capsulata CBS 1993]CDK25640.1 unnamed protein product [Kuraishia capsulata CBS 1993]